MRLSWLLFVRLIAGGIGFFPPLAAAVALDPRQYGLGASVFAMGLLVVGPLAQYASQGYMRALLLPERPQVAASHIVLVFMVLLVPMLAILLLIGTVAPISAALFLFVVFALTICRLEEVRQVAAERQILSVLFFYILPPFLVTLAFTGAALLHLPLPWPAITAIMGTCYLLPALASILVRGGRIASGLATVRPHHLRTLWVESRTFLVSGMVSAATENLPTLALTWLGVPQRVATFEVVRKLSSAISVFLHGLAIAFAPRLIKAVAADDMPQVIGVIRQNAKLSALFALVYIPLAVVGIVVLGMLHWKTLSIPAGIAAPLFASAIVTCIAAPFGMAVAAFHREHWWIVGGGIGLAAFCATLLLAPVLGPMQTVAMAVLIQNIALSATITSVIVRAIRARLRRPSSPSIAAIGPAT